MICCGHTAVQYLGLPMAVIKIKWFGVPTNKYVKVYIGLKMLFWAKPEGGSRIVILRLPITLPKNVILKYLSAAKHGKRLSVALLLY